MSRPGPLQWLLWAYVAFIASSSTFAIQAALNQSGNAGHPSMHGLLLGVPELLAALALLAPASRLIACAVLLAIYAVASVVSVTSGDVLGVLRFVYYGATAMLVTVAGPGRQPRQTTSAP